MMSERPSYEEKYRKLVETAPYGIQFTDLEGRILLSNPAHHRIQGYENGELIGKLIWDLMVDDTHKAKAKAFYQILIREQPRPEVYFSRDRKRNGKEIDVQINWDYVYDEEGKIEGIISIISDITDQKAIEARLQQAQKMEAIGALAGGIAHDFNNILFPIIGYTEMLLEDTPKESPNRSSLEEIHTGALRARDLVHQILAFSRQEKNDCNLMKVQPIIKEALKLIRCSIPANISICQDLQPECGAITANPTQIHQIVMNLSTNAYHAMEGNGGELSVALKEVKIGQHDLISPDMHPGVYACLTVADTGTGMDKAIVGRIFEPFFTTKGAGKGTGMGLSVVHGIVKSMNGAVQVYSDPGRGTQIHVYLPVAGSALEHQPSDASEPLPGGSERILLVDDEISIIAVERQILERLGYQVTSLASSREALEVFRTDPEKFDLVMTDMSMPEMTGDKLAAELIKIRPDIPILMCTGLSDTLTDEKMQSTGIAGVIMKPILTRSLAGRLRETLDVARRQSEF